MPSSRVLVVAFGGILVTGLVGPSAVARVDGSINHEVGTTATAASTACTHTHAPHPVRRPQFVRRMATGETGWCSSPGLVDLNGDGRLEIVAPFYSTFVFDAKGHLLSRRTATEGRVYAPSVVSDLEGDG